MMGLVWTPSTIVVALVVARLDGLAGKDMRSAWDGIRDAAKGEPVACVIASATPDGKVALLAGGTDAAVGVQADVTDADAVQAAVDAAVADAVIAELEPILQKRADQNSR